MSADGSVIVGGGQGEAFRWTASGGMAGLGIFPGATSGTVAEGVSADGSVVVGWGTNGSNQREAFRWTAEGGLMGLGDLPGGGFDSNANATSADGSVVVGHGRVGQEDFRAFRWTAGGGMQDLGVLPGAQFPNPLVNIALAVSADGSTVVGTASSPTSGEAFIWDEANGMRQLDDVLRGLGLDLGDWTLTAATGISADGLTIVGRGQHPFHNGVHEGWIAVIPEPGTGLLVMIGLLGLSCRQRRHGAEPADGPGAGLPHLGGEFSDFRDSPGS